MEKSKDATNEGFADLEATTKLQMKQFNANMTEVS